jgi:hypothetical protein
VRLRLTALLAVGVIVLGCSSDVVWPEGAANGAELISCPTWDCGPLYRAVELGMNNHLPGHAAIDRMYLGRLVCGSAEDLKHCSVNPAVGSTGQYVVPVDLVGAADPLLMLVFCWREPQGVPGEVEWNGKWCFSQPQ